MDQGFSVHTGSIDLQRFERDSTQHHRQAGAGTTGLIVRQATHRRFSYLLGSLFWLTLAGQVIAADGQSDEVRSAANHFLDTLSAGQREAVTFALKSDVRATWSNLPTLLQPPAGILLGSLGDEQRSAAQQLLRASLSSQGYAKTTAIMWLDDVLKELESARLVDSPELRANPIAVAMADNRSSGNYAIAVFGSPGDESWGWKLTGHHLAINVTVAGNAVGFLPAFFGSNPMIVPEGRYAGWMAMPGAVSM